MKKVFILLTNLLLFFSNIFAQCDSVMIAESNSSYDGLSKTIYHYSPSGKLLSREWIKESNSNWVPQERYEYTYDSNDSLTSWSFLNWVNPTWVILFSWDYTYTGSGKHFTTTFTSYNTGVPYIASKDSNVYDVQDRISISFNYDNGTLSRTTYSYNVLGQSTSDLTEKQNGSGVWDFISRSDRYFNTNGYLAEEYNLEYNLTVWDSLTASFYFYGTDAFADSIISREYTTPYTDNMNIYEYGYFDHIDIRTELSWNGTEWIYGYRYIDQIDSSGNRIYYGQSHAWYDSLGTITFDTLTQTNYQYDSLGNMISYEEYVSNGSGSYGAYTYSNGVLISSDDYYFAPHFGRDVFTNYYYTEILGDSIVCNNGTTTLSVDSCAGRTYLWSNGQTTPSITVSTGSYYVDVTYPNGYTTRSPITTVTTSALYFDVVPTTCIGCDNGIVFSHLTNPIGFITYSISPAIGTQNYDEFQPLPAGIYQICATDSLGCIYCDSVEVPEDPTSLNVISSNGVIVFPNPTHESIFINSDNTSSYEKYSIENSNGKKVMFGKLNSEHTNIKLTSLSDGVYFMTLIGKENKTIRIVKN